MADPIQGSRSWEHRTPTISQPQGLPDPQPIDEHRSLRLSAEVRTPPLALARRVKAEHRDVAAVATAQTLEDRHRRRPPGAVAPGDAEDLITADRERHANKHWLSVAGLVQVVGLDRCALHAANAKRRWPIAHRPTGPS